MVNNKISSVTNNIFKIITIHFKCLPNKLSRSSLEPDQQTSSLPTTSKWTSNQGNSESTATKPTWVRWTINLTTGNSSSIQSCITPPKMMFMTRLLQVSYKALLLATMELSCATGKQVLVKHSPCLVSLIITSREVLSQELFSRFITRSATNSIKQLLSESVTSKFIMKGW